MGALRDMSALAYAALLCACVGCGAKCIQAVVLHTYYLLYVVCAGKCCVDLLRTACADVVQLQQS